MYRNLLFLLLAVGLTGCAGFLPQSERVRLFVLGPDAAVGTGADEGARPGSVRLYLSRPEIPAYLESKQMLYRGADGELKPIAGGRWAETLEEGLARTLALYLGQREPFPMPGYYPFPDVEAESRRLRVRFHRFEALEDGRVSLVAEWRIERGDDTVRRGFHAVPDVTWKPAAPESMLAGLNRALERLAEEIAADLEAADVADGPSGVPRSSGP